MQTSKRSSGMLLVALLAVIKVLLHVFVGATTEYGIFRDEFYYLACADHLAWGYVDHPPLSMTILAGWKAVFGDSLLSLRWLAALFGGAVVFAAGRLAAMLSPSRWAPVLTALAVLAAPGFWGVHGFYSMNVIDHLFWIALTAIVVRMLQTDNPKLWLLFGAVAGLGLLNKYSVAFLVVGLGAGLLLTPQRRFLKSKYLWLGAALGLLIVAPHLVWQFQHGWPTLEFMRDAAATKNVHFGLGAFLVEQIINMNPAALLLWLPGLVALFVFKPLRPFRLFGIAWLVLLAVFVLQGGKPYYLFPMFPILFAAGAKLWRDLAVRYRVRILEPIIAFSLLALMVMALPMALPILPPVQYQIYAETIGVQPAAGERHDRGALPQHFADRFGWKHKVKTLADAYQALPDSLREQTAIFVQNYGQAGAVDYYGNEFGLPPALCGHNNYFYWGLRGQQPETVIVLGGDKRDLVLLFETVEQVDTFTHPYVMPYENNLAVYVCRGLRVPFAEVWPQVKDFG